ncbi:MAG: hypothetical protein J0H42_06590 [Rhizobiales bacterium]|nr:hypothetical protein [Hyphomicrobiales bacterium]
MATRSPVRWLAVIGVAVLGEADLGFQQVSELIHVEGVRFVGTIVAELQPGFSFAGALTDTATQPAH